MRYIKIWKKGKLFETKIVDSFSGESLIIDCDNISKKPLTEKEYADIPDVAKMMSSNIPLSSFSLQ